MQRHSFSPLSPSALKAPRTVCVYDFRCEGVRVPPKRLETRDLDINGFLQDLRKEFKCSPNETFVLVTTDRVTLDFNTFRVLKDGSALYMLQHERQDLPTATEENISYTPHYRTLTEAGTYEYYDSQGQKPLPYVLAELIDNALSATVKNAAERRRIEIQMILDETVGKPAIIVLDNGCGMTSKQLKNWAVYKLSKFQRDDSSCPSHTKGYVKPDPVPRSLNSDLSYFGVGGKQAVFFIGDSARMITKAESSPDVHELVICEEEFISKESNNEDIYSGTIKNRRPGDSSHIIRQDEEFIHSLIAAEKGKKSFTAVVITGIKPKNITFMKEDFDVLTRQLSNIYHYYLHGEDVKNPTTNFKSNIDIVLLLQEKPPQLPREVNLRDIEDDMQTLYINSAADTFEFKAKTVKPVGTVEGIIRYHPFLYDKETYPKEPNTAQDTPGEDKDYDEDYQALSQARGKRPIFDCFWNGRLIPSTTVSEFEWCSCPVREATVPAECYSRISGVLFTDDEYKVTQNKLTFIDLELQLKNKDTIFTTAVNGQKTTYKRGNIEREFTQWLAKCHENFDKQVKFLNYIETITRPDVTPKLRQTPWATFSAIEWDGKVYKAAQLVKSVKTQSIYYGTVCRFLLYGSHNGDTFGPGGQVEIIREPKDLYNMHKTFSISKIDRAATDEIIKKNIDLNNSKLPEKLEVEWPEGNPWPQDAVRPAGSSLGPLKVRILNSKGDSMSIMPKVGQGSAPKLFVRQAVTYHGPDKKTQQQQDCFDAQYSSKFNYWFRKYDNLTKMGKYTVTLEAILNEDRSSVSRQRPLPSVAFQFTITAGEADSFVLQEICQTLRVGVPFEIPLQIKDAYGHLTTPPPELTPLLKCSGLGVTYTSVDNNSTFKIKGVTAKGKIQNYQQSKNYDLRVTLAGLKNDTQILKINLLPGLPHTLHLTPKENPIRIENGKQVNFNIEVHDEAGNITANPKQIVGCQIQGFPPKTVDCSKTGAGQFGMPINLKMIKGESQTLKVNFDSIISGKVLLATKELTVLPSTRVVRMELCSHGDNLVFKNNDKIEWLAGGVLEDLIYKLYDEGGREVALNDNIASRIKVTWTNEVNLDSLVEGMLPDLHVPTKVSDKHFHQVTYQDVFSAFEIIPHPGEPKRLKATLPEKVVKLGETLTKNIILELVDQYDNRTMTLSPPCIDIMSVEAEGLDKSSITFVWQEENSSVTVTGIRFVSGALGPRGIFFTYCDYLEQVIVNVTPGSPAELKLLSGPNQPLQVLNNHGIPTPFEVQLCDKWGNPSPDKRVVVEMITSPQGLKVIASVSSQPVDEEGKACFNIIELSGAKGYYELKFQGLFNHTPINGPRLNLIVIPDPKKPVSLKVQYDTTAKFSAGGIFPVFTVTVVSDEGRPVQNLSPASLTMLLWKGPSTGNQPPQKATKKRCSAHIENDRRDCFYFRDKEIPEEVGNFVIQFSLQVCKDELLFSAQIPVNVVAKPPVRLSPECPILSPVVSYSTDISHRILVTDMTLYLVDIYGNPAGQDLDGRVSVSIVCPEGDTHKTIPQFELKCSRFQINLIDGKAHITRLAIMENSPGENGCSYILLFQPELKMPSTPLEPYNLPFHFHNDADNQRKISEMTKMKDELTKKITLYKKGFDESQQYLKMVTNLYNDALQKAKEYTFKLSRGNITLPQSVSIQTINKMIKEKREEGEKISHMPRRVCKVPDPFKGQPDVLGKVCHLATVQDDDAARVITWQIGNKMNSVVTRTTEAANRIYKDTQRQQMLLALDSVFVSPDRPLPHEQNGQLLFNPPGNPVKARNLLTYSEDRESCIKVFKNLLGNTILIDDIQSANSYRREIAKRKMPCPTLLTRDGERVSAQGFFGGLENTAPPLNSLPYVFGAPRPERFNLLAGQSMMLEEYKELVEKTEEAKHEQDQHRINMTSPEQLKQRQEMLANEEQLEKLEKELALLQNRSVRRQLESDENTSGIPAKRHKI